MEIEHTKNSYQNKLKLKQKSMEKYVNVHRNNMFI